ncbi:FtsK/SpoIIIE family DNA translocase [Alienimonas chondri]|uniref:DNA translocase FtsK n=1 Tax=Alienimonas chondri TaxID=2681879 RepID=A0ABX1VAZ3_9PLAN|nr:DNA translocase FtsK 4TM domain-containing protein [Alienimonas chondri]NNJ24467.1 DNA translocase FtsK [Alienimonas chondri]
MIDVKRLGQDLAALALLAVTAFLGLALFSFDPADLAGGTVWPAHEEPANLCGPAGARAAWHLRNLLGLGAWLLWVRLAWVDLRLFAREATAEPVLKLVGWGLTLVGVCAGLAALLPGANAGVPTGGGGLLGAGCTAILNDNFSAAGTGVLLAAIVAAGLLLAGDFGTIGAVAATAGGAAAVPFTAAGRAFDRTRLRVSRWQADRRAAAQQRAAEREAIQDEKAAKKAAIAAEKQAPSVERVPPKANAEAVVAPPAEILPAKDPDKKSFRVNLPAGPKPAAATRSHTLPPTDLLEPPEPFPFEELAEKARVAAETLEQTFSDFGLNVTVSEIDTGPVVTQFELDLEKGLRVNKVAALADDLAVALRVPAVRIVNPIPGKNTVGVEVPNDTRVMVRLREIAETATGADDMAIPIFLGKDVSGAPLVVDLAKMPHLLIAGRTGTGKSVCLNTLILSMLLSRTPDEVKMLMIDPKMVELSPYKTLPHLMHPVITDMKKAEAVLAWAVDKMEERYELLAQCGVRHLTDFNEMPRATKLDKMGLSELHEEADALTEKMPYIVIVADEMADLMMTNGKEVESHIIRLAQKSRAVGIHLVLATQKPTVDVITGLIKSNLPARISFQVASKSDSRVVLDESGAERLLGNGDMLYLTPGTSSLVRSQGAFVGGSEIDRVIDFFGDCEPEYDESIEQATTAGSVGGGEGGGLHGSARDDMYIQAVECVVREGRGSTSLLQRALGVGYGRAARMIDHMAEDGFLSGHNGSQAREVLLDVEAFEELRAAG